jgi:polynucleotide 5'-hydroxyl-kinase GRC3/NOL9
MPLLKLDPGEAVKLYGPMLVTLRSGCLDVHGRIVKPGEKFTVHKTRNYVVVADEASELEVSMIEDSQIQSLDPSDPYLLKIKLVDDALNKGYRRIMVLGCVDCGKTSLTTILFNKMISRGLKPVAVDSDVGQADIGPPCFVTMGSSTKQVYWLSELEPIYMRFIGDNKPQYYGHAIIYETILLSNIALSKGYDSIVVDTDGWVKDESGILHKVLFIERFKPDAIFVLGEELQGVFRDLSKVGVGVYELPAPIHRKTRSREERRLLRSLRYSVFLENAGFTKLKMDDLVVIGHPLFTGREVDANTISQFIDGRVIYATGFSGALHIYGVVRGYNVEELKKLGFEKIKVYTPGFEKNLYCSIGEVGSIDYPCLIEKFNFENREIVVKTKYTGRARVLKLSRIKLSENYIEEYLEVGGQ